MQTAPGIAALTQYPQWVVYKLVRREGEKPTKIPYSPLTGKPASSVNPSTWTDYQTALAASVNYDGLGFVFTEQDPFFFLDLDGCFDSDRGSVIDDAQGVVNMFPGAAWEISQSGQGLHIVGICDAAALGNRRNKWVAAVPCEFYTRERFMALGRDGVHGWQGDASLDWTRSLDLVVPIRLDDNTTDDGTVIGDAPVPEWNGPEDDAELIERALKARGSTAQILGTKASFRDLWEADPHVLAKHFPDDTDRRLYDASQADQSLMNALAYWTGKYHSRMIRIFSASVLGQREKWKSRAYYRNRTASGSIRSVWRVYNGDRIEQRERQLSEAQAIGEVEPDELIAPILDVDQMLARFFLVVDGSKDGLGMIDAAIKKPRSLTQAMTFYSSSKVLIPTDKKDPTTGLPIEKKADAFNIWKSDPRRRHVDMITWNPSALEICRDAERNGVAFNLWDGLNVPRYAPWYMLPENAQALEDATIQWRTHLEYLVPIPEERRRFEQWVAHIFQRPGELPQTAYLMYTDKVTGVGRGWLSIILANALRGHTALGVNISAAVDDRGFNGRLSRKLLGVVDEAKAGMADGQRYQRAETLKSRINERFREIKNKYGMEWTEYNCMRWLFFSNHADALPFDSNDRRIAVIENPNMQHRDGAAYYEWLYSVINDESFTSAVFARLMTLDISDFKPGEHAPMNAAKIRSLSDMEPTATKAMREACNDIGPDNVTTLSAMTRMLHEDYGVDLDKLSPKATWHMFRDLGVISFKKRIRIFGNKETILIVNPTALSLDMFWDLDAKNWKPGAATSLKNHIESAQLPPLDQK